MKYAMINQVGIVSWLEDSEAEQALGYGEHVYEVTQVVTLPSGSPAIMVSAPIWFDEKGAFNMCVTGCSPENSVRAAQKAVDYLLEIN